MAFRQPIFAPSSRPTTAHEPEHEATTTLPSPLHGGLQESREWVLFPQAFSSTHTQTTSTERTPRTAGLSRLSDFGSLAARSRQDDDVACEATDGSVEDDKELDSLDEGLHAFQEPASRPAYLDQSGSILPRHDGLGTFPTSSPPVQEQLWHFERYNPRKRSISGHQRRRSSVQRRLDAVEDNDSAMLDGERRERIEKWRMEQSKVLLDEIERETRRRKTSKHSQRVESAPNSAGLERIIKETVDTQTHEDLRGVSNAADDAASEDDESFWQRITRRVIRDFIGLDDATLSVIFGESLTEEISSARNPSSSLGSSKAVRLDTSIPSQPKASWEGRLLDRIARELGILVGQLSDHPGAFSTPLLPSIPDYAGIPVTVPTSSKSQPRPNTLRSSASFNFDPTLHETDLVTPNSTADSSHAALWGIEEEPTTQSPQDERDYWEQSPDIKTVFHFLHNRFTNPRLPSPAAKSPLNIATTSTPDSFRRAAVIRQYHPLVSRAASAWEQRHGPVRRHSLLRGRSGSSCASSVVLGSARRIGLRGASLGSSSRNYWDIGGSTVGSGGASAIGVGGLGAWGEI
jgi:hypothetical protein